ncbi:MAG: M56 family metallopeptidase [Acidobacteriota bacterium]
MEPLSLVIKVTVVLAAAVAVTGAVRGRAASTRHLLWTTTFLALVALPAAVRWLPALDLSLAAAAAGLGGSAADSAASTSWAWTWGRWLWAAGTAAALASLVAGALRFTAWARSGEPLNDPSWRSTVDALRGELGVRRRVRLVLSAEATVPMVGGVLRPVLLLPPSALGWNDARRRAVLAHELIHVRRHDPLRQLLAGAALAVYWFHPLAWLASHRAALSREEACDEGVLELGLRPSDYAAELLALADVAPSTRAAAALPLVEPSQLERRIAGILSPHRPGPKRLQAALLSGLLLLGAVTTAAAASSVPKAECSYKNPIPR